MFGLFKKDPIKQMERDYQTLLKQAMEVQRNGDIKQYSELMKEADNILSAIERVEGIKT